MITSFPRSFSKKQIRVNSKDEFDKLVETIGKDDVFISSNSYPGEWNYVKETEFINIHQIFFDFDHKTKLENSLHDVRLLAKWCNENNIPAYYSFSGRKGFHLFMQLIPAVYSLTEKIPVTTTQSATLKNYYRSFYYKIKNEIKLRTLDPHCSEPLRLCRVWNTIHPKSMLYCIPLTKDQLQLSTEDIKSLAKEKQPFPTSLTPSIKFHQLIDDFSIDPNMSKLDLAGIESIRFAQWGEGEGERWDNMKKIMPPGYPCILRDMYHQSNPSHMARFASAVFWKDMFDKSPPIEGKRLFAPQWIEDFYRQQSYDDVTNSRERESHINSIFRNNYKIPTCRTLYESDICIGEKCPKFAQYLGDTDGKKVKVYENE